ncbi:MAG: GntR family transcriptional regulator [Beijerinckiaceae bacterium]|nr:GntR family transcriptional regulator [Beijerinckiaceae bacterium]
MNEKTNSQDEARGTPGFLPLYRQVKSLLVRRIAERFWQPGEILPSEMQIAAELGVSQGTVRKALDEMTAERLLVRRQGRGTFVARHDESRILFQFFKIVPETGIPVFPESHLRRVETALASPEEVARLALRPGDSVIRIARVRSLNGRPTISEYLALPLERFPGLVGQADIPNNLYDHFASDYGITIAGGDESLRAMAAPAEDAALLGIPEGTPLLAIDRVALDLDGKPVEWRYSLCDTRHCHYVSGLR